MIVGNNKPVRIIGYAQSSMTQEFVNEISKTHTVEVILPVDFLTNQSRDYQYIVSVTVDFVERKRVIDTLDQNNFNLITVIHDTAQVGTNPPAEIQPGTFIFPFCTIALGSSIGRHCIIGPYSLIGHYSQLGDNCVVRPGVNVCGKSTVGNNCVLGIQSTVINHVTLVDGVELIAFTKVAKNIDQPGRYAGSNARPVVGS
jgi:UDP-3-O-[3-hydroxymyristoyl] glucosamine N-acyltransferase